MKYDLITIGGATEDLAIYTDEGILINNKKDILRQKLLAFEYGAKVKVDKADHTLGGGAINAAICLSRLGFNVAAMVAVGNDDRGKRIINNLKKEKVKTKLIQIIKNEISGFTASIISQDNEHVSFPIRGANTRLLITDSNLRQIKKADWLYLTSLSGDKKAWLASLDKIFSSEKVKIAWNPGHLQLIEGKKTLNKYLKKTELLIVNIDEARELIISDKKYSSNKSAFFDDTKKLLEIIKQWVPGTVVITEGKKGASAIDAANKFYKISSNSSVKQINTVGVGDAFGSSLVAGLKLYKGDILKAMELGKKNTASVITKAGAQTGLIYKKDIL